MRFPALQRLSWDSGRTATEAASDHAVMARSLAYLAGAGATATLLMFLFLPRPEASTPGMLGTVAAAYILFAIALIWYGRIPEGAFPPLVAFGTLLITAGTYFRGAPTTAHALFYLWVVFYSFYFFRRRVAIAELVFALACYAVVLLSIERKPPHMTEVWLITVATLVVCGWLVGSLKNRIDRLVARLADAARTDVLTGLLNRRGFEELFDLELERARRGNRMMSVLVGDLDHFKQVNDRFGHQAGDIALECASDLLRVKKRRIDTVARIGGEEFALIVPDTDDHRSYMLAERLRVAMKEIFKDDPVPLTISFGVATYPLHGQTPASLLNAADEALYAAKELGRDRTVIYSSEIAGVLSQGGEHVVQKGEHLSTVLALAETLDIRDAGTARHSQTVGRYAAMIARELGMEPEAIEWVRLAGILHDVGKIGISDAALSKPGPLDESEWEEIFRHPEIGARILGNARLSEIADWVLAHHERPDGTGYPFGVSAQEIPLEARILAVADAYEAMTSDRAYRPALTHPEAQLELERNAGAQFDENVVFTFLACLRRQDAASSIEK